MSDYLGRLVARYLSQNASIRPEPVSVYEPPPPDWELAADAEVESPCLSHSEADSSISRPSRVDQDGGALTLPPSPPSSEAFAITKSGGGSSITPSTPRGAFFARSPSGEDSSISSLSRGDFKTPSPVREEQGGDVET